MGKDVLHDRPTDTDEEITEGMLQAGMKELLEFDRRYRMDEDLVILIFDAMVKAQREERRADTANVWNGNCQHSKSSFF